MDRLNILIVDDDPEDYLIIAKMLAAVERTKCVVSHAVSFQEVVNIFGTHTHYDAILLDYYLRGKTASDVLEQAQLAGFLEPIIVITGLGQAELDDKVIQMGAADFLPKEELSPTLLERTIRHAIERLKTRNELQRLVRQDGLTGLANRIHFEDVLDRTISLAKRRGHQFAVLFVDLDRFKQINDSLGHNVGDLLLKIVAERLARAVRKEDIVARIGGDEFTILLNNICSSDDAMTVAQKILSELNLPVPINNMGLEPRASIGIALYPDAGESNIELMQHADIALYQAKQAGKNTAFFFNQSLRDSLDRQLLLERRLREALDSGSGLSLHYQPQFNLETGALVGAEALLRWHDAQIGMITPDEFIPVAENSRLIVPLGEWVLETAMAQCQAWKRQGWSLCVAVNVSPIQLKRPEFVPLLLDRLSHYQLVPSDIELEVTEAMFIDRNDPCVDSLRELNSWGMPIAIDDFGTGYSSLSYLRQLPVTRLKIDRSFVSHDGHAALAESAIVQSIVDLARSLGLSLIAEGIETKDQKMALLSKGCTYGQGFLLGTPVTAAQFDANFLPVSAGWTDEY